MKNFTSFDIQERYEAALQLAESTTHEPTKMHIIDRTHQAAHSNSMIAIVRLLEDIKRRLD